MNRYLLRFSYIGTSFNNFVKNVYFNQKWITGENTVIGAIECGLLRLNPVNKLDIITSSRTDVGVHALCNTIHVDMQLQNGKPYNNEKLMRKLNRYFSNSNLSIRILSAEIVPQTFHARYNVKSRSYLYQLAVLRNPISEWNRDDNDDILEPDGKLLSIQSIPMEDHKRCYYRFSTKQFDIDRVRDAAQLFVGRHDFRTFMGTSNLIKKLPARFATREIISMDIVPGQPKTTKLNFEFANKHFQYWNIHVNAKSFVYRQIRRIIGSLIAVGEGTISKRDIYEMITIPSRHSWKNVRTAPPFGLYLTDIEYNQESEIISKENAMEKRASELHTCRIRKI